MALGGWTRDLIDLLLPSGCVSCGGWIPARDHGEQALVCAGCRIRMRPGTWPRCARCHWPRGTGRAADAACRECADWSMALTGARFAYELATPVDDLVHGLKYEGWRELASMMGDAIARLEVPMDGGTRGLVVVPVPTTAKRLRTRGYNQAELLARRVAELRRLPLVHALERHGAAGSQTTLTREERRGNVRGAFVPTFQGSRARGRTVLLVDDVLTTGATACEAAEALTRVDVAGVVALTFARAAPSRARDAA